MKPFGNHGKSSEIIRNQVTSAKSREFFASLLESYEIEGNLMKSGEAHENERKSEEILVCFFARVAICVLSS